MLLESGDFTLHSGEKSYWKINCDNFSLNEAEILAKLITLKVGAFTNVTHPETTSLFIPYLAKLLLKYRTVRPYTLLIIDDVLTTSSSMEEVKRIFDGSGEIKGAVIFARKIPPPWIKPIFQM